MDNNKLARDILWELDTQTRQDLGTAHIIHICRAHDPRHAIEYRRTRSTVPQAYDRLLEVYDRLSR